MATLQEHYVNFHKQLEPVVEQMEQNQEPAMYAGMLQALLTWACVVGMRSYHTPMLKLPLITQRVWEFLCKECDKESLTTKKE